VDLDELTTAGPIPGTVYNGPATIPEITIKDPERTGTAKWKMIDRETKDSGTWTKQDVAMAWREGRKPKEPRIGEEPTISRRQQTGQLAWCYLVKCPKAVYRNPVMADQLEDDL
jgi:hypothetical protein